MKRLMVNDGFCDLCKTFCGRLEIMSFGNVMFCPECREKWNEVPMKNIIEKFREILRLAE